MKLTDPIHVLALASLLLLPLASPAAEPPKAPLAALGTEPVVPTSLTAGTVMKIKVALTTTTQVEVQGQYGVPETGNQLNEETLTWESSSSYGDPDGDKFSCNFKKTDKFTAQFTFTQTKAGGGETLQDEFGTGKYILLFSSYDKATNTFYGTVTMADRYRGKDYKDSSSGSGIFSLKLK